VKIIDEEHLLCKFRPIIHRSKTRKTMLVNIFTYTNMIAYSFLKTSHVLKPKYRGICNMYIIDDIALNNFEIPTIPFYLNFGLIMSSIIVCYSLYHVINHTHTRYKTSPLPYTVHPKRKHYYQDKETKHRPTPLANLYATKKILNTIIHMASE
jgi:hypothetical protein